MNPLQALARPEFASLAAVLLHFLWQGTLVAVLLAAGKRLFRIENAAQRYACSLVALVAMALCPVVTYLAVAPQWTQALPMTAEAIELEPMTHDAVASPASLETWTQAAQPYFLTLWLAGVFTFGLRLTVGMVGVWRIQRDRLPLPLELAARVARLGKKLGIDALPRVFVSRHVSEAIAAGFWRPVVLVPAAWVTEMPLVMLEGVIAHELAHLRRFDLWVNLLQRVVETLLFYHPAVWWVSRQLRQEREMCCDELAVKATGARLAYVETLELVARERLAGVRPALAAGIRGESNMKLLARVRNVLGGSGEATNLWPAGLLAFLLPLAIWAVTFGVLSPTPPAAVADDDDDGERAKKDREDGVRERRDRDGNDDEKEVRKDGDRPRKEGERRDGEGRKEGPRDGEQPRKEGARDGDAPVKKPIRKEGDRPRKEGARDGEEVRKAPVKKEIRKEQPAGDAQKKKIVKEGDAPKKEAIKKDGDGAAKLEAMIKELRAENEKLRAELRALRGEQRAQPDKEREILRDRAEAGREELIKRLGEARERAADGRAAVAEKIRALAEQKERAAAEAAEAKERAAAKEREAIERKEREIERRRDEERARADKVDKN